MSLLVVGDLHLNSNNEIKYKQGKMFMEWFKNQDFNNEENSVLFLGDLIEFNSSFESVGLLHNWFHNELKFKKILIIQGNHDCTPYDSILNCFKDLKRVNLFTEPTVYEDEDLGLKYLILPHYDVESTNCFTNKKMSELYSNLYLDEKFNKEFDFGFGHVTDETQNFGSGEFCDLSKLNVRYWMLGHIHTRNNFSLTRGKYLGSVTKNSSTEKDDKKYIGMVTDEGCWEEIEVPNFLSYINCEYGEFPKVETPLAFFQVNNAPSKNDVELKYKEYYKGICDIGFNKIITLRQNVMNGEGGVISDNVDEETLFDNFAKEKELSNEVVEICKKVM